MPDMNDALIIASHGMRVQSERTRVIAENLANAQTTGLTPEEDPYSRKIITFKNVMDRDHGFHLVRVEDISDDTPPEFPLKYMPDSPAANEAGYVKMPNVKTLVEVNDMREAQRSYEASVGMVEQSRTMAFRTIDLLR